MSESKLEKYLRAIGRGCLLALSSFLLYLLITGIIMISYNTRDPLFWDMKPFVVCIFCTAFFPLIYNSFALAFSYSDRSAIRDFCEREDKEVSFFDEMKRIFSCGLTMTEISAAALLTAVFAALGFFISFGLMFPLGMPLGNFLPILTLTPISMILSVFSKYEAARYYFKLYRENSIDKLLSPWWLLWRIVLIVVLYTVAAPLSPLLVLAVYMVFGLVAEITTLMSVLGVIAAVAAVLLAVWLFKVMLGISKRRKFLKKLKAQAAEKGATLGKIRHPYRSFISSKDHCSFSLAMGEKKYDCVVISTIWKRPYLVFTSTAEVHIAHVIGTENHNFTLRHKMDFYHTGEGNKMIIVNPVPKRVLVQEDGNERRINCTDMIWNITLHDAESFLGCMDRDCLDGRSPIQND